MDGPSLPWFQWHQRAKSFRSWEDFTQQLEVTFGPSEYEDPQEMLVKLTQTSTVADYRQKFDELANRITGVSNSFLLSCFIAGLREDIRHEVKAFKPHTLAQTVGLARLQEQKLATRNMGSRPRGVASPMVTHHYNSGLTSPAPVMQSGSPGVRRLTAREMQERRQKNLCYNCDEKWSAQHRCKNHPHLLMVEFEEERMALDNDEDAEAAEQISSAISFHAMAGIPSYATFRFTGFIGNSQVQVLLDGGSTHSFIRTSVARSLGFPIEHVPSFAVAVGNGGRLLTEGRLVNTPISIQGHEFHPELFVLAVHGADVILGAAWLSTLGWVRQNYDKLILEFEVDGKVIQLRGEPRHTPQPAHFHSLQRMYRTEAIAESFKVDINKIIEDSTPKSPGVAPIPYEMSTLLDHFEDIFQKPQGLPPPRTVDHSIPLQPGTGPVNIRPYRYPHYQKGVIESMVQEMLEDGVIQLSSSPFSSPIVLVRKKDGTWRFCTDYRALNAITVKDRFPIPTIDELFDELHGVHGALFFSKLDLRSGYHQIRVHPKDIHKTAFRTHEGHYEYRVMPFGLTNAPATFQNLMNLVFKPMLRKFVLVFLDDILVYSRTWDDHLHHVHIVLKTLREHTLFAKREKCSFGASQVEYLGHIISCNGVSMDDAKVKAMLEWPTPTSQKEVRGFLGLTGFYRRFVRGYAQIAAALTDLLKRDGFHWSQLADKAFDALKRGLTSAPIFAMPDFTQAFIVETDASGIGIGAVLTQSGHPIAYFSKKLSPRMQAASTYHREMFAITCAVKKWRHYLLGRRFTVLTDQRSLRELMAQTIQTPEQQKWLTKLLGFDFEIRFRPGRKNAVADALSRCHPEEGLFYAISGPIVHLLNDLSLAIQQDRELQSIIMALQNGAVELQGYQLVQGMLLFHNRIVVPNDDTIRMQLLREFHDTPIGGHAGVQRTYRCMASELYWKGLREDVKRFVAQCVICQQVKYITAPPAGLLQPLPIPHQIWEDISMDFVVGLPPSSGKTVVFVVVDRLSKYAHFIPIASGFTSASIAEIFVREIVRLHGMPSTIVSDRDRVFISTFWQELFRLQGTKLAMSSAYHPESDGQTEVTNRTLEMYLRCFTLDQPKKWAVFHTLGRICL